MLNELHIEYYDELLQYINEFTHFKNEYCPDDTCKHK